MTATANRRPRVLAVASKGGHWIQLLRLRPAFANCDVTFVTTDPRSRNDVPGHAFRTVQDANRDRKLALLLQILKMAWIVLTVRPDAVVSTGASCGYVALRFAKIIGARTLFIDSIANAEKLSLSGQLAGKHADLLLTQWPQLAGKSGARYEGAVL